MDLHLLTRSAVLVQILMTFLVAARPANNEHRCGSIINTGGSKPSPVPILHNLLAQTALTHSQVQALYTQYCKQRSTEQYCAEAKEVQEFFLAEQVATSSGISNQIEKSKKAYTDLSNILLAITRSIEHESKVEEYRSLLEEFENIRFHVSTLQCILKIYVEAHESQVEQEAGLHMMYNIESTEGQVLADIYMLIHLNHILTRIHKDFSAPN